MAPFLACLPRPCPTSTWQHRPQMGNLLVPTHPSTQMAFRRHILHVSISTTSSLPTLFTFQRGMSKNGIICFLVIISSFCIMYFLINLLCSLMPALGLQSLRVDYFDVICSVTVRLVNMNKRHSANVEAC